MAGKNYIPGHVRACEVTTFSPAQCVCVTTLALMTQCRHSSQCFYSPFLEFSSS